MNVSLARAHIVAFALCIGVGFSPVHASGRGPALQSRPRVLQQVTPSVPAPSPTSHQPASTTASQSGTIASPPVSQDPASEARREVEEILGKPDYRFCHDPEYLMGNDSRRWCSLVAEHDPRCPTFGAACKLAPASDARLSGEGCTGERAGKGVHGSQHGQKEPSSEHAFKLELGPGLALALRVVFFVLLGLFVTYIARAILKNMRKHGSMGSDDVVSKTPSEPASEASCSTATQVETDVDRLLARARAAADRGEFEPALGDTYAALLRKLDGDGLIQVHPARTNGEYVRALSARPELMQSVGAVVRDVERVQFGASPASSERFRAVYERVLAIVGRAATLLIVFALLPAFSCSDTREAVSLGPLGTEALVDLLDRHGSTFDSSVVLTRQLHGPKTLLLIDTDLDANEWEEVIRWAERDRGTIVAVGKSLQTLPSAGMLPTSGKEDGPAQLTPTAAMFSGSFDLRSPAGRRLEIRHGIEAVPLVTRGDEVYAAYRRLPLGDQSTTSAVGDHDDDDGDHDADEDDDDADGAEEADAEEADAELGVHDETDNNDDSCESKAGAHHDCKRDEGVDRTSGARPVRRRRLAGTFVAFSDSRLFQSIALSVGDNPAFLLSLFGETPASVVLWDALSGHGASTPMESIHRAHLTPVMLHLIAFFGLLLLYKGVAFGKLREPPGRSSRRFADHVRALGNAYARAHASTHVMGLYAAWALERLRERAKMTGRSGLSPLAEALAVQTGRSEAEVMGVLLEAHSAKEDIAPGAVGPGPNQAPGHALADRADPAARAAEFALMQKLDRFLGSGGDHT